MTRLIYLHGFASSPGAYKATRFVEAMGRQHPGVELLVPDLVAGDFRGQTIGKQVALVDGLLRDRPAGSCLIVGSSMGAYVGALAAAARPEPVAALALIAPAFYLAARWEQMLGAEAIARWQAEGQMEVQNYATDRMEPVGWTLLEDARAQVPAPSLSQPTLILHGRQDEVVDPAGSEACARDHENVTLKLLDADHGMNEVSEAVIAEILDFFAPWLVGQ